MKQATALIPHAIVYLFDPTNESADTPDYTAGEIVSNNGQCISVGTQSYVDGEVAICLLDISEKDAMQSSSKLAYRGDFSTPGKQVAVETSECKTLLGGTVKESSTAVEVWVDDMANPGTVYFVLDL